MEKTKNATHNAWDKENTRFIGLKLNRNTDSDIIDRLEKEPSKQGFIKECIRAALQREL